MPGADASAGPGFGVLGEGSLAGRRCIVTGAGSGIGRAIALRLLGLGADVHGMGRRAEALDETAARAEALAGSFYPLCCDIRDPAAVAAAIAGIGGRVDALVNNAGGQFASPAEAITDRGWASVIDLNLTAVFTLCREAFPLMAAGGGSIVNISLSNVDRGSPGVAHSIAARAGVLGLSRTLALEWAEDGIRVNCIGPGSVRTDGSDANYQAGTLARVRNRAPLGRDTEPEEVAELTAWLVSPAAAMMTGQLLQIDGGAHLGDVLDMRLRPE